MPLGGMAAPRKPSRDLRERGTQLTAKCFVPFPAATVLPIVTRVVGAVVVGGVFSGVRALMTGPDPTVGAVVVGAEACVCLVLTVTVLAANLGDTFGAVGAVLFAKVLNIITGGVIAAAIAARKFNNT